jgi:hypothetical protein
MIRRAGSALALGGALLLGLAPAGPVVGQEYDAHFILPPAELEARLGGEPFQVLGMQDNRWEGDRTQRSALQFRDGTVVQVKWAVAAHGGFAMNNQPRYELAAYELQKLLLDESDWVVPPTVLREMALPVYRQLDPEMEPTFEGTASVLITIQYWLREVDFFEAPDTARAAVDDEYARHLGHLTLVTHLINHVDSNAGNILISTTGGSRMFAVDNGVAFRAPESPRGTLWKSLHGDRLPASAVARLRGLTRRDLEDALAVVAQFRVREDDRLEAVPPTAKLNPNRGVDHQGDLIQLGLTNLEIDDLWERCVALLDRIDAGEIRTF